MYDAMGGLRPAPTQFPTRAMPVQERKRSIFDKLFGVGIPDGLLSDEDRKGARKRALLMAGLGTMAAGSRPGANLGGSLAMGLMGGLQGGMEAYQQAAEGGMMQQKQMAAQQVAQAREQIYAKYPPAPGETPVQMLQRFGRMLPEFMRIGDTEMVGKLTELLKSVGGPAFGIEKPTEAKDPARVVGIGPDGKAYYFERGADGAWKNTGLQAREERPAGDGGLSAAQQLTAEDRLINQYEQKAAPIQKVYDDIRTAASELDRAVAGDAAAQVNVLYAFIRAMDPTSVVREGEIGLINRALPLRQRAELLAQQVSMTGKAVALHPDVAKQMISLMSRRAKDYHRHLSELRGRYVERGKARGVPSEYFGEPQPIEWADRIGAMGGGNPAAVDAFLKGRNR